ncbi:MAG: class I SAM-dependent methyltransferase [Gammaproteobacteria bacterium]|nr:class I SAM-dependent methyltransferase [Gammaproteobacteria bacterium]
MTVGAIELKLDLHTLPASLRPWLDALPAAAETPASGFVLRFLEDRLRLQSPEPGLGELEIDLGRGQAGYRGARARNERLVRACGVRAGSLIVDATGGLGTDAWLLASAGARVTVCEQHPVVAALLADGLRRAGVAHPEIAGRIELLGVDSRLALSRWDQPLTAIYMDPMYPPRRKRALGDRRLRLLSALFAQGGMEGRGDDVAGLLAAARAAPAARAVLKRPQRQPLPAGTPDPDYSLEGRSTRFDVWRRADIGV